MDFSFGLDRVGYLGVSKNGVSEQKSCGSVLKQGRPCGFLDDNSKTPQVGNDTCKMLKRDDVMSSKPMLLQTKPTILRSHALFPDANFEFSPLNKSHSAHDSMQTAVLPSFHSSYSKTPGLSSGSLNGDMHGVLGVVRGPFTPSQWLELEHQALIFKYIIAGVPIPPNLLLPIRRSMNPSPLSTFCAASLRPNAFGWGPFHLGFSGNPDPEPGRCRRTDGKKWRCSRDAVADQKYCERHMNRGRHRSRKPVEGQTGQATAGTTAASASKAAPVTAPSLTAPVSGNAPESLAIAQHQIKPFHQSADPSSAAANFSRFLINKCNVEDRIQNPQTDILQSSVNLKERESFSLLTQQLRSQESHPAFGMISSDSLLSDAQRNSYLQSKNFGLSSDLNAREPQQSHSLRSFIDDWPKIEEAQPERSQLSISEPIASSGFSLASPSQNQDKFAHSPLKLARETDPIQMGLGVGVQTDSLQRQANWALPSWETSLGGPLAEVLNSTNTNASALNLMTQGWDASSPLESSPTGVLTRTAFFSLSNSSAGSSPRAETNKVNDNGLSDEPLGSNVLRSATIIQS